MFTGIIEDIGEIKNIQHDQTNYEFEIEARIAPELKVDQSVSHNGACLTVTSVNGNRYTVTVINETLSRTNLGKLKEGDIVNLERCMQLDGRFDGHIVKGHVDQTGKIESIDNEEGSWLIWVSYDPGYNNITVEKGTICINGISLTVVQSGEGKFSVAIIPYTMSNTNLKHLKTNDIVNLEFDIIGKYIEKLFFEYYKK